MKPALLSISYALVTLGFAIAPRMNAEQPATAGEADSSVSPDKQWEYFGGKDAKLVKAAT